MGKILIVRYPKNTNPDTLKESHEATQRILGTGYAVLPFVTDVEKVEAEIVYDPHLSQERTEFISGEGSLSWRPK